MDELRPNGMRAPIDVSTGDTVAFIEAHVASGAEILEVGCGAGHVASELASRGYRVTGFEADADQVALARRYGVSVVQASWPSNVTARADAVVFTRSLHHIHPLGAAVARASELVGPGGILLVEDFAYRMADRRTIDWFLTVLRSPKARALLVARPGELVTGLLASAEPFEEWHRSHDPDLHGFDALTAEIEKRFAIRATESVPYLYRYLVPVLPETPDAAAFVADVFAEEARVGEWGEITLIGRRLVGPGRNAEAR